MVLIVMSRFLVLHFTGQLNRGDSVSNAIYGDATAMNKDYQGQILNFESRGAWLGVMAIGGEKGSDPFSPAFCPSLQPTVSALRGVKAWGRRRGAWPAPPGR